MAFDSINKTFVINLRSCKERKEHIINEFNNVGLTNYKFFDAVDKDSEEVKKMMYSEFVKKFPPCFRCNKIKCKCPNNVLIPQQIGNWCSFIGVFKEIISFKDINDGELFMICEDDIRFTRRWYAVFSKLINLKSMQSVGIDFNKPILIRLGSTKSHLHDKKWNPIFVKKIVMSNPCFIVNKHYAKSFLDNLKIIDTTSDLFIHKKLINIDRSIQHFTTSPLAVRDLSTGKDAKFYSMIHPKKIDEYDVQRHQEHFKRVNVDYYKFISIYKFNIFGTYCGGFKLFKSSILQKFPTAINLSKQLPTDSKLINCLIVESKENSFIDYNMDIYSSYNFNILIICNIVDTVVNRIHCYQKNKDKVYLIILDRFLQYYEMCLDEFLGNTNYINNKICINVDQIVNKNKKHIDYVTNLTNNNLNFENMLLDDYNSNKSNNYSKLNQENKKIVSIFVKKLYNKPKILSKCNQVFGKKYMENLFRKIEV